MKTTISIIISLLAAGTIAHAKTIEFNIVKATFASAHVNSAGNGNVKLDYAKKSVSLFVEEKNVCPPGRFCTMMMRAPLNVQLPIVSVTTDACGIRKVTAKDDKRPVDGDLKVITVTDPTDITCKMKMAVAPTATYKTEFFDRMSAKSVVDVSTMVLSVNAAIADTAMLETSLAPAILIKFVQNSGFSPMPSVKTLYVDKIGRVINTVKQLQTGKVVTTNLAQMSSVELADLNKMIGTIPSDAKLVDENEGEPRCMDAPSSVLSVSIKAKDMAIYSFQSCHTLTVQVGASEQLYKLMMNYLNLVK